MLGERLIKLRKARKWTQTDLAEQCGVSRNSIVNWESDKREPKIGDIQKLAEVFQVSPNDLIGNESVIHHTQSDIMEIPTNIETESLTYWGGMLNKVSQTVERGNTQEINAIIPIVKTALSMLLLSVGEPLVATHKETAPAVSAYNGNNSRYINSTINLEQATA